MQLYILIDDLRPELGAYGITTPMAGGTPNIDRLAGDSLLFERVYVQQVNERALNSPLLKPFDGTFTCTPTDNLQAVCGPSRNSFLSGRRPDTTKTYTFQNSFRDVGPNWTSMLGYHVPCPLSNSAPTIPTLPRHLDF